MYINSYFDVSCDFCNRATSTDFGVGFFKTKKEAKLWVKENGWKTEQGSNKCRNCLIKDIISKKISKILNEESFEIEVGISYGDFYLTIIVEEYMVQEIKNIIDEMNFKDILIFVQKKH